MFRTAWRDLREKFRTWWVCDRIRISPCEGQLLRIQTGDLLTIRGMDLEVIDRSVASSVAVQSLQLNCRAPSGSVKLLVQIEQDLFHYSATLTQCGIQEAIDSGEVQIWPRRLLANRR